MRLPSIRKKLKNVKEVEKQNVGDFRLIM